ncbi:MAG: metal-dependent hydrolase [Thermomicrobiales bacterium]|nr:metal-dependent hydrolase [Thermomicrobiales bacterium]MCO5221953.1 metal-dependent hydrolase [Thermomicrobiales bacterium]
MKRVTHITTGAAVALPVAAGLSPAAAAGAIFLGMAGAVVPDYADLKSDARRFLTHRGLSHSLLFAAAATALVYMLLTALTGVDDTRFRLHADLVEPLLAAFALGIGSHLLLDAATPSGIRPGLPFVDARLRILPPGMRIPTGSRRDGIIHSMTSLIVLIGLCYLVFEHIR